MSSHAWCTFTQFSKRMIYEQEVGYISTGTYMIYEVSIYQLRRIRCRSVQIRRYGGFRVQKIAIKRTHLHDLFKIALSFLIVSKHGWVKGQYRQKKENENYILRTHYSQCVFRPQHKEIKVDFIKKSRLRTALCKFRLTAGNRRKPLPRLMSLLTLKHAQNVRILSRPKSVASSPWTQVRCTTQILRFRLRFGFSELTCYNPPKVLISYRFLDLCIGGVGMGAWDSQSRSCVSGFQNVNGLREKIKSPMTEYCRDDDGGAAFICTANGPIALIKL